MTSRWARSARRHDRATTYPARGSVDWSHNPSRDEHSIPLRVRFRKFLTQTRPVTGNSTPVTARAA